jgi:hypothetical protein
MAFDSIFPFLPSSAGTPPQLFPYDVVIHTAFPGVVFEGTEPNALYQEIREVNGCLWLVTNAQYNENLLQWDQEVNQNTTLPAYALELCDGAMTRYYSPATLIPDTPITWTPLWTVTATGLMDSTPLEITGASDPMNQLQVTWDPGPAIAPVAREVDITDIDSSPNSLLDNLVVNSVQVWAVNKEGVLVAGDIPYARITGAPIPPSFNNPTFTGTSTFDGPVVMDDGLTVTAGATTLEGTLNSTAGSTLAGGTTVTGGEAVTGGLNTDTFGVSGASFFNGLATFNDEITTDSITVTGPAVFDGTSTFNGPADFTGTTTFSGPVTGPGIDYPIGSVVVSYGGNGNTLTIPAVGTIWSAISTSVIQLSSPPSSVGNVIATGTGGTDGGSWAGGSNTLANPAQNSLNVPLNGLVHAGNTITYTVSSTGAVVVLSTNVTMVAVRQS